MAKSKPTDKLEIIENNISGIVEDERFTDSGGWTCSGDMILTIGGKDFYVPIHLWHHCPLSLSIKKGDFVVLQKEPEYGYRDFYKVIDVKKEATIKVIKNKYRTLRAGEIVRKNDQYFGDNQKWNNCTKQSIGKKVMSQSQYSQAVSKGIFSMDNEIMSRVEFRRKITE